MIPTACSVNAIKKLIATKRTLPAILRNDVPPLRFKGAAVQSLIATKRKLWGALHPDIGKTINHDGQPAVIVNVHESIQQIEVRPNQRIWTPRRAATKREFRNARIKRQLATGVRRVFSQQPHWRGEPFPAGKEVIPLKVFVDVLSTVEESTKRFLCSIGCGRLLVKSAKETRLMSAATRLHNLKEFLHSLVAIKKKELTENLTIEVLRRSQMSENRINAIYDVVFENTPAPEAARKRNLEVGSLQRTLWRIEAEIRPQVEMKLAEWMSREPEIAAANQELEALKDVGVVIALERVSAQNLR